MKAPEGRFIGSVHDKSAPTEIPFFLLKVIIGVGCRDASLRLSMTVLPRTMHPRIVTLSRSEGSIALGVETRC